MIIAKISDIQWDRDSETEILPHKLLFHLVKVTFNRKKILSIAENLYGYSVKDAKVKIYEASPENLNRLPDDVREYYLNLLRDFFNVRGKSLEKTIQESPEFDVIQDLISRESFTLPDMVQLSKEKLQLPEAIANSFAKKAIKIWIQLNYLEMTCDENGDFVYWVSKKD